MSDAGAAGESEGAPGRPEGAPGHPGLLRIRAPNPGPMTLTGTNTYIVGSDPAYVVDPGPDDAGHIDRVRAEGEARGGIAGVVLTHSHADHSAGVERLGAPLLFGNVAETSEFGAAGDAPVPDLPADGAEVGPMKLLATPGHAADHYALILGDVVLCGDLILGEGSSIVPPRAFGGSLSDYMRSLDAVAQLGAELFAPGHGPWITDPAAKVEEYTAHRNERERRLLAALETGERSRAALLAEVWDDVPKQLQPAAALAMQAHLEKLADDGRFREELSE